ncbi:F-box protein At-B-like [Helianthus annuus]|nr:F-box protein At-B-like [Helianthus annuus]
MSMLLLSEGCKGLESVRLGGFSKVSYAVFASILNSCLNLKKFEVKNGVRLPDLAFQDFNKVPRSLVEVKLVSCNSITSRAVCEVAKCNSLEVLDLNGCISVGDSGMTVLGKGNAPISCLSLRGCWSVSDRVTDASVKALALKGTLRRLDLYYCTVLSSESLQFLKKPFFRGLQWIGIGWTRLVHVDVVFAENFRERKWPTVCSYGCEVGCRDGWQDHEFSYWFFSVSW